MRWYQSERPRLSLVRSKSVLHRFMGAGLTLNPYVGCGHRCVYCYATYDWAPEFYDHIRAKRNAPELLSKELRGFLPLVPPIMLSSATDPYQPYEAQLKITRRILARCVEEGLPFYVFTKSVLVLRDLDLLALARDRCMVVFSLITANEALKRSLEPGTPSAKALLAAAQRLTQSGIRTGLNIAPVIPFLTDSEKDLRALIGQARARGVAYFEAAPLRLREDIWARLSAQLKDMGLGLIRARLEELYLMRGTRSAHYIHAPRSYCARLDRLVKGLVEEHGGIWGFPIEDRPGRALGALLYPSLPLKQSSLTAWVKAPATRG